MCPIGRTHRLRRSPRSRSLQNLSVSRVTSARRAATPRPVLRPPAGDLLRTTKKQSARASAASRCDGGPPTSRTVPATASSTPRRNWRRPAVDVSAAARAAVIRGRSGWGCPRAARSTGRTNTSKDTCELTGFPGSATTPTPSTRPHALRPARLHRDLDELDAPAAEALLDHLVGARADPARGEDEVDGAGRQALVEHAVQVRDVVGHEPQQLGDASGVLHRGGEHGAVRLVDLPRLQRGAGRDEFGAGGQHEHGRAAAHRQGRRADGRGHADLRRAQHRARRQHDRARRRRPRPPGGPRCPPRAPGTPAPGRGRRRCARPARSRRLRRAAGRRS